MNYSIIFAIAGIFLLSGCKNPALDTIVPTNSDQIETIMPKVKLLPKAEQTLFSLYMIQHTLDGRPIPPNTSIEQALQEEVNFIKLHCSPGQPANPSTVCPGQTNL